MLNVDPTKRLTIDQVMRNQWIAVSYFLLIWFIHLFESSILNFAICFNFSNTLRYHKRHYILVVYYEKAKIFGPRCKMKWLVRWPLWELIMIRLVKNSSWEYLENHQRFFNFFSDIFRCTSKLWTLQIIHYLINVANVLRNKLNESMIVHRILDHIPFVWLTVLKTNFIQNYFLKNFNVKNRIHDFWMHRNYNFFLSWSKFVSKNRDMNNWIELMNETTNKNQHINM